MLETAYRTAPGHGVPGVHRVALERAKDQLVNHLDCSHRRAHRGPGYPCFSLSLPPSLSFFESFCLFLSFYLILFLFLTVILGKLKAQMVRYMHLLARPVTFFHTYPTARGHNARGPWASPVLSVYRFKPFFLSTRACAGRPTVVLRPTHAELSRYTQMPLCS